MLRLHVDSRWIEIDEFGFLLEPGDWTHEVAEALAEHSSVGPLLDDHWRVILYIRGYYEEHAMAPMIRSINKRTQIGERRLKQLFPSSCRECMCLVAGLPKPTG